MASIAGASGATDVANDMLTYFGQTDDYDPQGNDVGSGYVLEIELGHLVTLDGLVLIMNQVDVLVRGSDAVQCSGDAFFWCG